MVEYIFIKLVKLPKTDKKKYKAIFKNKKTSREKSIKFGSQGASDYTINKDPERKKLYIARHSKMNENWTNSGIMTAGWWSRWLLWSEPNFNDALSLVKEKLKKAKYI